jgi:hypothetical protein
MPGTTPAEGVARVNVQRDIAVALAQRKPHVVFNALRGLFSEDVDLEWEIKRVRISGSVGR